MIQKPSLFGLHNSNRDFSNGNSWGKNQFNSSFPAALCCYLESKGIPANYLIQNGDNFICSEITIDTLFGISPKATNAFFAFETPHSPFTKYVIGKLPRTDLVIQDSATGECLSALEVKLTALPDNTTCLLKDELYGSEIVIRPDSIAYLACSIASGLGVDLVKSLHLIPESDILDWSDPKQVIPHLPTIYNSLYSIYFNLNSRQKPFLLQPIWKTMGKSPKLAENCLDVFVWSDAAFVKFISDISNLKHISSNIISISRQQRTAIWLYKMLEGILQSGKFNHFEIIDNCSYNTKNDKAFASSGNITNTFMKSQRLSCPIIHKSEIKNIILGGGQELLSPERRFDAIIYNSPELFL